MRSIIFTSLALCLASGSALADLPLGCFARNYDAAHLAAHPEQVVAAMRLEVFLADGTEGMNATPGTTLAMLDVVLADQGHIARTPAPEEGYPDGFGGAAMYQALICPGKGGMACGMACMGEVQEPGFDIVTQDGAALTIRTTSLPVGMGQDCGGFTDIAEVAGQPVTFVLDRVDDAVCDAD